MAYRILEVEGGHPIKMWTEDVPVEDDAPDLVEAVHTLRQLVCVKD